MPEETIKELIDLIKGFQFYEPHSTSTMKIDINGDNLPAIYRYGRGKWNFIKNAIEEDIRKVAVAKSNGNYYVQLLT